MNTEEIRKHVKEAKKQQEKRNRAYQRFYDMPLICPCCGKELHLTTKTGRGNDRGLEFDFEYSACSQCGSQIHESVDVLRRNQADLKFAVWEQKEKQKAYEKNLLEVTANEKLTISVDDLEKFAGTKIDNVRISITPDQLMAIKKSKKAEPIVLNVKQEESKYTLTEEEMHAVRSAVQVAVNAAANANAWRAHDKYEETYNMLDKKLED